MRKLWILLWVCAPAFALALPNEFVQEGLIYDAEGAPLDGAHDITVRLYAAAEGGDPLFSEEHADVELFEGYYAVSIGSIGDLTSAPFRRPSLYLGITIDGARELTPRTQIVKVPAAFVADVAENVVGDITPRTVSVGGDVVINENGEWVGPRPPGAGGGDEEGTFLSSNEDDVAEGNSITFDGGRVLFRGGGVRNALDLGNHNIIGANTLRFNDPGPGEGVIWDGTQAKIVVAPLNDANSDGFLRLVNDAGISLESDTRIQGDLTITGIINLVQRINVTLLVATTANITNANITNLNGPGGRVNVRGELNLLGDVRLSAATDFIGDLRLSGSLTAGGDITGRNFSARGSIVAAGNVESGAGGLLRSGTGGIWVRNIQVFDGNGNLLRRPVYACPAGRVMMGTDAAGRVRCANVTCPVNQYFRGVDGNGNAVCVVDAGLRALPVQNCPAGQAVRQVAANGSTTCSSPRAGNQTCPEGEFVTGLTPTGTVICAEAPEGGAQSGQCAPADVRANILVCTRSSRNVSTFIPAGYRFNVANGCDPNNQTQAMFVSRSGGGLAAGRAAAWQTYVRGGGVIITEYNISDDVWRAVFGAANQGPRRGSCRDNAMPVVKVNTNDPFWQANQDINPTPANAAACGYEVGGFPGITALGGWSANQINFGYRDLGDGRVWALDADWQDTDRGFTNDSVRLMGKLMTWCSDAGEDEEEEGGGLEFNGVRNNVPPAEIVGWRECHRSFYGARGASMAQILQNCDGEKIMYGCKANAAANWQVLGMGDRGAVFRDTGRSNAPTVNNGIGWYFNGSYSMGFAPQGQPLSRSSCDTQNGLGDKRICWHTSGNAMSGGWRCGNNRSLNGNNSYTRVIWTKAAGGGDEPGDLFTFQGVRENTADALLEGWEPCHTSRYNATVNGLTNIINNECRGDTVMMGCRPVGSATWRLLAQGPRATVFRDSGRNSNVVNNANGVNWYYNNSWSMGFSAQGAATRRSSCDTNRAPSSNLRMCWHTSGDRMTSGYRCGDSFLNGNGSWERRIWRPSAGGGAGPDLNRVFTSCLNARSAGQRANGVYRLRPPGEAERRVYCDMTTDGGGWTLVASTRNTTLNDQRSNYYNDLQRLDPAGGNTGVWWGLRAMSGRWDMRFTCRNSVQAAGAAMTVDLSFYDVPWYSEFTAGSDANSCFEETNGRGDQQPAPARKNNLNNATLPRGNNWNCSGYLEGEDSCGDTGDFTVDFDDRGMDCNQSDGTDWGEDDGSRKCGRSGLGSGQWFIFTRERGAAQ